MFIRLTFLFLVLPSAAAWAQAPSTALDLAARLAYFSPQRAFAISADGKAAQSTLAALEAQTAKAIEARAAKLKGLQDALRQGAAVLDDSARQQREREIQRFEIDVQRFIEDAQAEFLGVQRNLETTFYAKLRPAIGAVVKERGLLFLFNEDAGTLTWADPALDVTEDIVKRLDRP